MQFAFRLALQLGEENPWSLLSRMPSALLTYWREFFYLEPWGGRQEDYRAGVIVSAACHGKVQPSEVFVSLRDDRPQQSEEQQRAIIESVAAAWGRARVEGK